jgi:hypothetical protein
LKILWFSTISPLKILLLSTISPLSTVSLQGTFNPYEGVEAEEDCTPCTPGQYCDREGLNATSGPCEPGYYCPQGTVVVQFKSLIVFVVLFLMLLYYFSPGISLFYCC